MNKRKMQGNLLSLAIGGVIGIAMIPFIISARAEINTPIVTTLVEPLDLTVKENLPIHVEQSEKSFFIEPFEIESEETVSETLAECEEEPYFSYTQEDIYLVGNCTFEEVGNLYAKVSVEDAEKGARMTATCLVNRANMNYMGLGRSIKSQLIPSQYATAKKVSSQKEEKVPERFYEIAEDVMKNGPSVSPRLVFQAEFKQGKVVDHIYCEYFGELTEAEYKAYNSK